MAIKFTRKYLTVPEVLQRWQCSEIDLIHEIVEGNIPPIIYVSEPDEYTDKDGNTVFLPPESYISVDGDDLGELDPIFYSIGYLRLTAPLRTTINSCEFMLFENVTSPPGVFGRLKRFLPLEKYWNQMVFDIGEIINFERERTDVVPMGDDKPVATRERTTLLTIIAALAKKANLDVIGEPGKSALSIESLTDALPAHVSKRAIEEHLKKIPDALDRRMRDSA